MPTYSAEEMLARNLAKLETLEDRKVKYEEAAPIHHGAIVAALLVIQQQEKRIGNLEALVLQLDKKVNPEIAKPKVLCDMCGSTTRTRCGRLGCV